MIVRHLGRGQDAAVTYGELCDRLGMDRRSIEESVRLARLAGHPIVTGSAGVWLATSAQEAREAASKLRTRAVHQMETAAALERAADAMDTSVTQGTLPWAA